MKGRFTTGVVLGSLIGASAAMLMDNMDKKTVRGMKKKFNNMQSMFDQK